MIARTSRIAIVCQPWDNASARSGNSIGIIAYQLARHLPPNWRSTLYGRRYPGQKRWESDGDTIEFKRLFVIHKPHAVAEILFGILACYTKSRIRYHVSYFYHSFYALRVALSIRASKCDVILVFNFLHFASIIRFFNPSATLCLYMQCEWLTLFATASSERRLRDIDLIISCSDYITETVRRRFPVIAARCHTLYNGVDPELFRPPQRERVPSDNTKRLLYVGRVSPEKGVHVLIRAFKILADSRSVLRLDLVGSANTGRYLYFGGADLQDRAIAGLVERFYGNRLSDMVQKQLRRRGRGYVADLAGEIARDDRIVFHDTVLQPELREFYRQAAALVFPSVWNEPFGMPTAEAMASGLPVVSTYSGAIPEIVEQGRTGLLVPRGDADELARAIGQLLDDPARARAMGEAGRQRVIERFTWQVSARRLADLIASVSLSVPQMDIATRAERPV